MIFRRTEEELLGPPASWGTSLKSDLAHRPFRRAGLARRPKMCVFVMKARGLGAPDSRDGPRIAREEADGA